MHPRFSPAIDRATVRFSAGLLLPALLALTGCQSLNTRNPHFEAHLPPEQMVARELDKVALPPHRLAPPDVILVDAVKVIPLPPYKLEPLDFVQIQVTGALPDQPINDLYQIMAEGTVQLGGDYGSIAIVGLSIDEATAAIREHLSELLREPVVTVRLAQTAGQQQISGQHLVSPDGTINLGMYGRVFVAGLTLDETKQAIESHLEDQLLDPKVMVDMLAYNSRVYYIISDGAGTGTGITRIPLQGHETVLDAIANMNGLSAISNKNIWIARPAPDKAGYEQRLPVHIDDIMQRGLVATNYQVFPGDRIYIEGDRLIAIDARIARLTAPLERVAGAIFLGSSAIRNMNQSFRRDTGTGSGL